MLTAQFTTKSLNKPKGFCDFDSWLEAATVEHNIGTKYLVLTDYDHSIEVDIEHPTPKGTCWKADRELSAIQTEKLFEVVEDALKHGYKTVKGEPLIQ